MHYSNLVIVDARPEDSTIKDLVEQAMGPSEENGGFWDWYQIGGRWTGTFDGYEPDKDPANQERCDLCEGTGVRKDMVAIESGFTTRVINEEGHPRKGQVGWCNSCDGKGTRITWPTQWQERAGDCLPIEQLTEEHLKQIHRFVLPGYPPFEREDYMPWKNAFVEAETPPLAWLKERFAGYTCVIVDNHS